MEHLSLNELIEIYLGNSLYHGLETAESKKLAYQEIQKRTIEYRNITGISELVPKLNELLNHFTIIEKTNSITFIDNAYGQEIFEISKKLELYCLKKYNPRLLDLISEINNITNKLDIIWENDTERFRHSSKFLDRRNQSQSQSQSREYYSHHNLENILFTETKVWRYQISATLGYDYMKPILEESKKSDITFLPVLCINWNDNRALVLNFITTFNGMKQSNSYLWILFFTDMYNQNKIDEILFDIRMFSQKLINKSGFHFDLLPYSIIEETKSGDLDFNVLVKNVDEFTNKYIA